MCRVTMVTRVGYFITSTRLDYAEIHFKCAYKQFKMQYTMEPFYTCWSSTGLLCRSQDFKRQGVDAQLNDQHSCSYSLHRKLTAPPYNRGTCMNIMKGTSFIKVYDGNNSNSVCFFGNYVHLRTGLWELITPRVIWNPWASLSGFKSPWSWSTLTSRFSNEHNYLQTHAIVEKHIWNLYVFSFPAWNKSKMLK